MPLFKALFLVSRASPGQVTCSVRTPGFRLIGSIVCNECCPLSANGPECLKSLLVTILICLVVLRVIELH